MHLAICLWGLLRSLPHTIKSFEKYIVEPLKQYDITYDIILHTYQLNGSYSSTRNNEEKIELNISNYHLLNPQYIYIENQLEFDTKINYQLYQTYGDPWKNHFQSFKNHLRALNSLYHITKVVESLISRHEIHYDGIIFLRPDVQFLHPLPIELLPINDRSFYNILQQELPISPANPMPSRASDGLPSTTSIKRQQQMKTSKDEFFHNMLYLPDFHRSCQGQEYNDRMAMGSITYALQYGKKFENAYDYSLTHYLHAEKFTYDHLRTYSNILPIEISFRFRRIRASGNIHIRDYEAVTPLNQQLLANHGIYFISKGYRTPWHLRILYTLLEMITGYQRYVWNHDDHGNIFCHPNIYIKYSEYMHYMGSFQKHFHLYQQRLQQLLLQQQLHNSTSSAQPQQLVGTSKKKGEKGEKGDEESLLQYLHHKQKYFLYSQDSRRRIRCDYEVVTRHVDPIKHVSHAIKSSTRLKRLRSKQPDSFPFDDTPSWNVSDPTQFITSYLVPVNCTIVRHLHHHIHLHSKNNGSDFKRRKLNDSVTREDETNEAKESEKATSNNGDELISKDAPVEGEGRVSQERGRMGKQRKKRFRPSMRGEGNEE